MNLISDKTLEKENFRIVSNLIYKFIINSKEKNEHNFYHLINYQEFKKNIQKFITEIMKTFLEENNLNNKKCDVVIENLPSKIKGFFSEAKKDYDLLAIDESVIKSIYDGNVDDFMVIFHELNHFKVKCEIETGKINEDIIKIIKENLIRKSSKDPFNEMKSIKKGCQFINDDYYNDNYNLYSEEIYVSMQARKDYFFLIKSLTNDKNRQKYIIKLFNEQYKDEINFDIKRYGIHKRDFQKSFYFNDYYLDYEEAFDLLVQDNPDWLEYSQIAIEYYLDENGKVKKRDVDQLQELLKSSSNPQAIEYIVFLMNRKLKTTMEKNNKIK